MKFPEKIDPKHIHKLIILKLTTISIPVLVMIAGLFLPLREVVRQAMVGITLIWLYLEVIIGFS